MHPRPRPAFSGPRALEPLERSLLAVLPEVLYASVLHVLDRTLLGHARDDVEEVLEHSEHCLVDETLRLSLGSHNYEHNKSVTVRSDHAMN